MKSVVKERQDDDERGMGWGLTTSRSERTDMELLAVRFGATQAVFLGLVDLVIHLLEERAIHLVGIDDLARDTLEQVGESGRGSDAVVGSCNTCTSRQEQLNVDGKQDADSLTSTLR